MKMPFYTQNFHRSQEPENGVGLVWFLCFSSSVDQSIGRFVSAGQRPGEACPSQPPVQSQATSHSQFRVPDLVPSPFPFPCPVPLPPEPADIAAQKPPLPAEKPAAKAASVRVELWNFMQWLLPRLRFYFYLRGYFSHFTTSYMKLFIGSEGWLVVAGRLPLLATHPAERNKNATALHASNSQVAVAYRGFWEVEHSQTRLNSD